MVSKLYYDYRGAGRQSEVLRIYQSAEMCFRVYHITRPYSMILKATFSTTTLLDEFLGKLQVFGKTEMQVVFSTVLERH